MSPCISVIVPVYKVEKYLKECIDSILAQTYRDFELILVDDGSPDNCGKICDEYARRDDRIIVIHQENKGLSGARNTALDIAKGEFVTFIDSDDVVNIRYLELLLSGMDEDIDIVASLLHEFSGSFVDVCFDLDEAGYIKYTAKEGIVALYKNADGMNVCAAGKMYRSKTIGKLRFPVGRIHEDQYFTPLSFYRARNIAQCNLAVYYYRNHPESTMHRAFSAKRFDDIWAIDCCIKFFREKSEFDIVRIARHKREYLLA